MFNLEQALIWIMPTAFVVGGLATRATGRGHRVEVG